MRFSKYNSAISCDMLERRGSGKESEFNFWVFIKKYYLDLGLSAEEKLIILGAARSDGTKRVF